MLVSKAFCQQAATTPTSLGTLLRFTNDSLCLQPSDNLSNLRQLHSTTFGSNGSFWHLCIGWHQPGHCSRAQTTNGNVEGIEKAKSPHIWYMCFVLHSRVQSHFPSHFRGLGPARVAENGDKTRNPSLCVVLRITCKGYLTPALLIPWQCQFLQSISIKKCSNATLRRYDSPNPIIQFYRSSPISFSRLIGCWLRQSAMRSQSASAETETTRTTKTHDDCVPASLVATRCHGAQAPCSGMEMNRKHLPERLWTPQSAINQLWLQMCKKSTPLAAAAPSNFAAIGEAKYLPKQH